MRFIIDAQLPASLADYFHDHDVIHTSVMPGGNNTTDGNINDVSILEQRVLITKDTDFYYSFVASGRPY
jgi:predicted nuclease of predicted toxin-antitoxin system